MCQLRWSCMPPSLVHHFFYLSWKVYPSPCGSGHFPIILQNDGPVSRERVQRWNLVRANWDEFWHLSSIHLYQSAITDADDPILKDIAEETIPKTSGVPKCFNKPWFFVICNDATKEGNRALERFKRKPTKANLNAYHIARAKARRYPIE